MIEISNNKVRCDIESEPSPERTDEQEQLYQQVVEQSRIAHQLFEQYRNLYGTDKQGVMKILKLLNGGN